MALSSDRAGGGRPPPSAAPPATASEALPGDGADVPALPSSPVARLRKAPSRAGKTTARTKIPLVLPPDVIAEASPGTVELASLGAPGDIPEPSGQPGADPPTQAVAHVFEDSAGPEPQPPPLPAAPSPPAAPARGRPVRQGLWVVLLLVLLLAGALAYLLTAYRRHDPTDKPPLRIAGWSAWLSDWWKSKPGSAHAGAPANQPAAEAPPTRSYTHPLRRAQAAIQAVQAVRRETPLIQPAPSNSAPQAAVPSEPPLGSAPPAAPLAQAVTPAEAPVVVWPEIVVSATVGSGTRGSALINGVLLTVGEETNEGLLLEKIEPRAAILSYRGETRRFAVGKR